KLFVSAAVPGAGEGFVFKGETRGEREIHLLDVGNDLSHWFDIALPTALEDVVLRHLAVTFNTATRHFNFECDGYLSVEGTRVEITELKVNVARQPDNSYTGALEGIVSIGGRQFKLDFSKGDKATYLIAAYTSKEGDTIDLKGLVAAVAPATAEYIPSELSIKVKDIWFAHTRTAPGTSGEGEGNGANTTSQDGSGGAGTTGDTSTATPASTSSFLFGLDLRTNLDLSALPLVGKELPPEASIGVDNLRLLVSSQPLKQEEVATLNGSLPPNIAPLPSAGIAQGLNVTAQMRLGTQSLALSIQPTAKSSSPTPPSTPPSTAAVATQPGEPSADSTKWFAIQKSFGPVSFNRVGLQYQDGKLTFLLDAALTAAGLTLSLEGLGFGSSLSDFKPTFTLRGLGVQYANPPVEIAGGFLRMGEEEYGGVAKIKTPDFTLAAFGAYKSLNGHPSIFVYAVLDYPIGGPTFFFVTGLAAGFGYNRALVAPTLDKLPDFPLIAAAKPPASTQPATSSIPSVSTQPATSKDPVQMLADFEKAVPPAIGEYFLALGVRFTSFKLIDGFALLTATFGHRFELG
ncbi:MAG TPA: DUF6603 domain-containing protein, partial [Chloroflexia bacterium]|nr:DUF6603 domain-containing protein [Chloroflexia bacterium]